MADKADMAGWLEGLDVFELAALNDRYQLGGLDRAELIEAVEARITELEQLQL